MSRKVVSAVSLLVSAATKTGEMADRGLVSLGTVLVPGPSSDWFPKALIVFLFLLPWLVESGMTHWPQDFCGRGTGAGGTGTHSRCFGLPDVFLLQMTCK